MSKYSFKSIFLFIIGIVLFLLGLFMTLSILIRAFTIDKLFLSTRWRLIQNKTDYVEVVRIVVS